MTPIEKLALIGIPTRSAAAAIQHMRDGGWMEKTTEDYRYLIADVTSSEPPTEDENELNYTFRYVVQEALQNREMRGKELVALAYEKAKAFLAANAYVLAKPEADATPKLDAAGNVKPKKGAKKEMALRVYNEQIKDVDGMTRKRAIEILMEEVGMTAGGASTYYANLKKGTL